MEAWSDGSVFSLKWEVGGSEPEREYRGQKSEKDVQHLVDLLEEAKATTYQQYDNMTTKLSWQTADSRYDWSWSSFDKDKIPQVLQSVKAFLGQSNHLSPGTPPSFEWGNTRARQGSAELFLSQGQTFRLTLKPQATEGDAPVSIFVGKGTYPVGQLSDLSGKSIPLENDEGSITISTVKGGWLTGEVTKNGTTGTFRLPAWVTVAP